MKILWLDTETTGLYPVKNDIIQLSCIVDIDGKEVDRFNSYMKPFDEGNIQYEALSVTGHKREDVLNFPDPVVVFNDFIDFLDKHVDKYNRNDKFILGGHNVIFDKKFIESTAKKCGFKYLFSYIDYHTMDTAQMVMICRLLGFMGPGSTKLIDVCKQFGIELSAHDSMNDIKATKELAYTLKSLILGEKKND